MPLPDQATEKTQPPTGEAGGNSPLGLRWLLPEQDGLVFNTETIRIGRSSECQIRLSGTSVSRIHAEIVRQGPIWILRDLGSSNGTFVNGRRVEASLIEHGSVVRVGPFVGLVTEWCRADSVGVRELSPGFWAGNEFARVVAPALDAADSKLPIAIDGETGTGKERVASAIHMASSRPGPFVAVNCAAVPEHLAEAHFFGHVKGAFTGAGQAATGLFRAADRGTLFLDEVADLPLSLQAKLLRALQEKEVTPVGAHKALQVDVRVICASQRPLDEYVKQGRFRMDLMMRLNGVSVTIPALRDRPSDIPHLLKLFASREVDWSTLFVEPRVMEALCVFPWPGNVRQLELTVQRLITLGKLPRALRFSDLPREVAASCETSATEPLREESTNSASLPAEAWSAQSNPRDANDRLRLLQALEQNAGNVAASAKAAGISRQRAYRLLRDRAPISLLDKVRESVKRLKVGAEPACQGSET